MRYVMYDQYVLINLLTKPNRQMLAVDVSTKVGYIINSNFFKCTISKSTISTWDNNQYALERVSCS